MTRIRLGDLYRDKRESSAAYIEYGRAVDEFEALADPLWRARAHASRSLAALDLGQGEAALAISAESLAVFRSMLSPADECWCLVIQARASELLGRSVEATSYLQQAEQLAHALGRGPDHVQRLMNDTGPDVR